MNQCDGISSTPELRKAIRPYYQFLLLMKRKSKITGTHVGYRLRMAHPSIVPQAYQRYCAEGVVRQTNHDDSLEKNVIVSGLRLSGLAGLKGYNQPYTVKNLKKAYFIRDWCPLSPVRNCIVSCRTEVAEGAAR